MCGGHVERHGAGELVGMVPAPLCPVPRLMHSIDGERGAMSKQRHPAVMIEVAQAFPEQLRFVGKLLFPLRSEEHTSELQSLMRISYAVFCLKKNNIA